jgi:hypothetical protein
MGLTTVGVVVMSTAVGSAQFADSVVDYVPGTGNAPGFTNASTALGAPTMALSYGPVDPFNPPFAQSNVVSIGTGGWLTLEFNASIENKPTDSFWGIDFVVFGNEGFLDTNWPAGMTDGQLFNQAFGTPGTSRVLVSEDGVDYYELQIPVSFSAAVDTLFPPDSAGVIGQPANPNLTNADFAGLDLNGIRALYAGSAGGAGFDLDWAVDDANQSVALSSASFIRIEVTESKVEVDAISVVPEPTTAALALFGIAGTALGRHFKRRPKAGTSQR